MRHSDCLFVFLFRINLSRLFCLLPQRWFQISRLLRIARQLRQTTTSVRWCFRPRFGFRRWAFHQKILFAPNVLFIDTIWVWVYDVRFTFRILRYCVCVMICVENLTISNVNTNNEYANTQPIQLCGMRFWFSVLLLVLWLFGFSDVVSLHCCLLPHMHTVYIILSPLGCQIVMLGA